MVKPKVSLKLTKVWEFHRKWLLNPSVNAIIEHGHSVPKQLGLIKERFIMSIKDMAEAHLRNVQQQIGDLQEQRKRIEADIQQLSQYLQQGVAELNNGNQPAVPELVTSSPTSEGQANIPSLSLPPSARG